MLRLLILLGLLTCAVTPLGAQAVAGTLLDGGTGGPLAGALVVLLDDAGQRTAATLTDEAGRFALRAPKAGRYRVRADRIGHRSTFSPPVEVGPGERVELTLESMVEAIALEGIMVESESRCEVRPGVGRQAAILWEEARKALEAAAWTENQGALEYRVERYERELDPERLEVLREQRFPRSGYHDGSPFVSLPAERLQREGYIRAEPLGEYVYYAPDAEALLSEAFLDGHCFRVANRPAPEEGLIGLAFQPVGRRAEADITGVLWLDRNTAELRYLDYAYTRLPGDLITDRAGGRVEFARIPAGPWIVRRWWIRMPLVGVRELPPEAGPNRRRAFLAGVREEGGEVLGARRADGTLLMESADATIAGVVRDSLGGGAVAGAGVEVVGTSFRATTDDRGRFHIAGLPEGRYRVRLAGARVDSLGVEPAAREIELQRGRTTRVDLILPPPPPVLAADCPEGGSCAPPASPHAAPERAIPLDPVVVTARSEADSRRRAAGHSQLLVLQRADIEQAIRDGATEIGDLARRHEALGVQVAGLMNGADPGGTCVQSARSFMDRARGTFQNPSGGAVCAMVELILDGARIADPQVPHVLRGLRLSELESIEFLPPTEAAFRYGGGVSGGVLVVRTRVR